MPFNGFENFEACTLAMQKKGHDEESAKKICGSLQADAEGGGKKDSADEARADMIPNDMSNMRQTIGYKAYDAHHTAHEKSAAVSQHAPGSLEHNIAHETAANAHREAASINEKAGNKDRAQEHREAAGAHAAASGALRTAAKSVGRANQASAKAEAGTGTHAAAANAHGAAANALAKAGNHELAAKHAGMAADHSAKAASGGGDDYNRDEHGKFASK